MPRLCKTQATFTREDPLTTSRNILYDFKTSRCIGASWFIWSKLDRDVENKNFTPNKPVQSVTQNFSELCNNSIETSRLIINWPTFLPLQTVPWFISLLAMKLKRPITTMRGFVLVVLLSFQLPAIISWICVCFVSSRPKNSSRHSSRDNSRIVWQHSQASLVNLKMKLSHWNRSYGGEETSTWDKKQNFLSLSLHDDASHGRLQWESSPDHRDNHRNDIFASV